MNTFRERRGSLSQTEEPHDSTGTTSAVNNSNNINTNFNNNNNNDVGASARHFPLFTDFNGKFKARLSAVIPAHVSSVSENAPSAKYDCRIKAEYQKDIMGLVEEGMIMAVKNFKTKLDGNNNASLYTLLVASRVWPNTMACGQSLSTHTTPCSLKLSSNLFLTGVPMIKRP